MKLFLGIGFTLLALTISGCGQNRLKVSPRASSTSSSYAPDTEAAGRGSSPENDAAAAGVSSGAAASYQGSGMGVGSSAGAPPFCGAIREGVVSVTYAERGVHSSAPAVGIDSSCPNPTILLASSTLPLPCADMDGTAVSGPIACYNNPGRVSTPVRPYFFFESSETVRLFLSNEDGARAGGPYPISYRIVCAAPSAPTEAFCVSQLTGRTVTFAGTVTVTVTSGARSSSAGHVRLPHTCHNPTYRAQSYVESVSCGTASGISICEGAPHSSSRDVFVEASVVDPMTVAFRLNAGGGPIWQPSPTTYRIGYEITCE